MDTNNLTVTRHGTFVTKIGESIRYELNVIDKTGNPVDMTGAEVTFRLAAALGDVALVTKTHLDGITISADIITIEFNTTEVGGTGKFVDEVKAVLNGNTVYILEGEIVINNIIIAS